MAEENIREVDLIGGIDIDISGFRQYELEATYGNISSFFENFADFTFSGLEKPQKKQIGSSRVCAPWIDGVWDVGGVELKLSYRKIREARVLSLLVNGAEGKEELAKEMLERIGKQKEIMEKTGRMYPIEPMMKLVGIDASRFVNERLLLFDEYEEYAGRRERLDVILDVHREFGDLMNLRLEMEGEHNSIGEHKGLKIDCSNIETKWKTDNDYCAKIRLVSRVEVAGALPRQMLYAIVSAGTGSAIDDYAMVLRGVKKAKEKIESCSMARGKLKPGSIKAEWYDAIPKPGDPKVTMAKNGMNGGLAGFFQRMRNRATIKLRH
jgi:hypothetical protein